MDIVSLTKHLRKHEREPDVVYQVNTYKSEKQNSLKIVKYYRRFTKSYDSAETNLPPHNSGDAVLGYNFEKTNFLNEDFKSSLLFLVAVVTMERTVGGNATDISR